MTNADEIPRYAPPTQAELEEMFADAADMCETCAHHVTVRCTLLDKRLPARRATRTVEACALCHDRDGAEGLEELTGPVAECSGWELADA